MKKILLTIFAALFFVSSSSMMASQKKKSLEKCTFNFIAELREKALKIDGVTLNEIPREVFSIICSFIGPNISDKSVIEYQPRSYSTEDHPNILPGVSWDYPLPSKYYFWGSSKVIVPRKFQTGNLKKMSFVSKSMKNFVDYHLSLLQKSVKQLEVVVVWPEDTKCQYSLLPGADIEEDVEVKQKIKEQRKEIEAYRDQNFPYAKLSWTEKDKAKKKDCECMEEPFSYLLAQIDGLL